MSEVNLLTDEDAATGAGQLKPINSLHDLETDDINANLGTVRGLAMLENSIQTHGVGESITVDKNNRIIGGNKRTETMVETGFGDAEPIVVDTDGTRPVILRRTDLDLDDPKARELGIALNRTAQVSINFDGGNLARLQDMGVNLAPHFDQPELAGIMNLHNAAANAAAAAAASIGPHLLSTPAISTEEPDAPESFKLVDESIKTDHKCPKCGYEWAGSAT